MASQAQIAQRREQVWRLHLEGKSASVIAAVLDVSRRTIVGDLEACSKHAKEELRELDTFRYLSVMIERFNQQRRSAWIGYEEAVERGDHNAALRYLRLVVTVETKEFTALQKLGFFDALQRQATRRENPLATEMDGIDLARLDALAVMILTERSELIPKEMVEWMGCGKRGEMPRSLLSPTHNSSSTSDESDEAGC